MFIFMTDGERVRICKTFLINTLRITERRLRTMTEVKVLGSGIIPEDKRGNIITING